jgi:phosphate transport system substrate-binding protein
MKRFSTFLFFLPLLLSCENSTSTVPTDTTSSGEVKVVVDESFQPLFETQIFTFQSLNPHAKINVSYQSEGNALELLMKDSCKVVFMCRDLTTNEKNSFKAQNIYPISTKIAEDAIALIVHPQNADSILNVQQIKSILMGKDSLWSSVNPTSTLGKIEVVFDNQGSANARYMQDSILNGAVFGKNTFAVNSNKQVIDYVSKNKNAIGILSVNWISDMDDPKVQAFKQKIKVLAVATTSNSSSFKPFQAYIKTGEYPFTRNVFAINRQTRAGLGMGFVHFVAGDKGQLIILKSGLVPAIAPVRLVEVNIEKE